jgi:hypothetical protein
MIASKSGYRVFIELGPYNAYPSLIYKKHPLCEFKQHLPLGHSSFNMYKTTSSTTPSQKPPVLRNKYQRGYGTKLHLGKSKKKHKKTHLKKQRRRPIQHGRGKIKDFLKKMKKKLTPVIKRTLPGLISNVP